MLDILTANKSEFNISQCVYFPKIAIKFAKVQY